MPQVEAEFDVRAIPPSKRHQEIFRTFDSLEPEQSFVLVNDHDPKPLLYQFQAERPARFEWSRLEAGPARFRIEIRRRADDGPRSVSEFLQGDHARLERILLEAKRRVGEGDLAPARVVFAEFACGLDWHINVEEQVLFPAFEAATGMQGAGPTEVMRAEHVRIRRAMSDATAALAAGDGAGFGDAVRALELVLGVHNVKEEQVLYPMTDQAAGSERERDELVRRLQLS